MAEKLTKEQAIKLAKTEWWKECDALTIAKFQLFIDLLCCPFDIFHASLEESIKRPVQTIEFGLFADNLKLELLDGCPSPSFQDLIGLLPAKILSSLF